MFEDKLERLSNSCGIAGREEDVRKVVKGYGEFVEDNAGNLYTKKGSGKKVMLVAHMDEVGFIVKYVDDRGFIWFEKVGGIEDSLLEGRDVTSAGVRGTIGSYPPHVKEKVASRELFMDFGFASKKRQRMQG